MMDSSPEEICPADPGFEDPGPADPGFEDPDPGDPPWEDGVSGDPSWEDGGPVDPPWEDDGPGESGDGCSGAFGDCFPERMPDEPQEPAGTAKQERHR